MTPDMIETIGLAISGSGVTSPASRRKARAAIAAIEAAGFVIVPREPTGKIIYALIGERGLMGVYDNTDNAGFNQFCAKEKTSIQPFLLNSARPKGAVE